MFLVVGKRASGQSAYYKVWIVCKKERRARFSCPGKKNCGNGKYRSLLSAHVLWSRMRRAATKGN